MSDDSAFGGSSVGGGFGMGFTQQPSPPDPDQGAPAPDTTAAAAPSAGLGSSFGSSFGASFKSIMPGPNYTPPDPQMSPLDQSADLLQQRATRANSIATNPLLQLFAPEQVQKAREFAPQAAEALQKIRTQQADILAGRQQAGKLGISGQVPDEASTEDRMQFAVQRAIGGDLRAFQGIRAVDPKRAEAIQDQVYEAGAGHLKNAQTAFDSLSSMPTQGQYAAKLAQLREDGTLGDLEKMGLKVPATMAEFSASKAQEGQALRNANIAMQDVRTKLEQRNTVQGLGNKESEPFDGRLKTTYGDNLNGKWGTRASDGSYGLIVNGAADPRDLGKNFSLASPDQRKELREAVTASVPKEEIEKYRAEGRTYSLATTDANGNKLPAGQINSNPNVQQGIAEGLAAMLRGGSGGANIGLLKIETAKRGYLQALADKITTEKAGVINELKGNDVAPYLTKLTQAQQRDVLDALKQYNDISIGKRFQDIAKRAGALGLNATDLGAGDMADALAGPLEEGRQAQIARMMPNHQSLGGGDGWFMLGAQRPGQGAVQAPGTNPSTQLPGAQPLQNPAQQASNPPAGGPPSVGGGQAPQGAVPPAPGTSGGPQGSGGPTPGAGQPTTVAGQSVSVPLPPGASPQFVSSLQRVESGNEKSPWTSTTRNTSASGAFQFINSTWQQNKPAGAPDRAGDATSQQQAEALATLTQKNANSLNAAKIPVNDTSLYVAHNLGAGGAVSLFSAPPTADARSVVGDTAANNNPMFFKGRPTVATVMQRYQSAMAGEGNKAPPGKVDTSGLPDVGAAPWTGRTTPAGDHIASPEERANSPVVNYAPAIGSTAGAIGGSLVAPGAGSVVGGGVGGGAGQAFKDWMQGRPQSLAAIGKQTALGTVLGIAPEGAPLLGAALRVGGTAAVEGGATAAAGGDAGDIAGAAAEGGAYALGSEALGKFISALGPAAHRVLSSYKPDAQAAISEMAGKLSEARKTLETEEPKIAGAAGASTPNPKYDAAKATEEAAVKYIKDHGQNPDDMVYAYDQAKEGVSSGEAFTMRKANAEKAAVSQGYNDLRQQVGDIGVGAPKATTSIPDGPASMLRTAENPTGKVEEKFRPDAEHAEMLAGAPAKDWGEKWSQLQNAGTELINKRMAFLQAGDKPSAKAMDSLFQGVRNQQKAAAQYVFGPERGATIIKNLENLDTRYAKVMNATNGMSYERMQSTLAGGNTPEARELEKNFKEFAKGDPQAIRAFNAMKAGARGDWKSEAALMTPIIAGEAASHLAGVPTFGAVSASIGGYRLYKIMQGYMNARVLGKAVKFGDFLASELGNTSADRAQSAAQTGRVIQRGVVAQGQQ